MNSVEFPLISSNNSQIEQPILSEGVKVSEEPSPSGQINNVYRTTIKQFVAVLRKHKWYTSAMVVGTLLLEPWAALKAGFMNVSNCKKHFNFHNLNPKVLTKEQSLKQPILLIHGNFHNQSAWMTLAKELAGEQLGPLYTVDLPSGEVTDKDYAIIQTKISEIKDQYKELNVNSIKIDVVGHSRGGFLAHRIAWTKLEGDGKRYWAVSEDIGKVISIGSVLDQEELMHIEEQDPNFRDRIYEITGKYDILTTDSSLLDANHKKEVNTGHLGLLFSPVTHQHIMHWLG